MNEIFHSIAVNVNDVLRDDVRYDVTKVARILSCKDKLFVDMYEMTRKMYEMMIISVS